MIYYKNLKANRVEDILLHASQDAENWNEEQRESLKAIVEAVQKWNDLNKKEEKVFEDETLETEKEIYKIQLKRENLRKGVSWWKLQGNQGMAYRENRKPFAFKVVGYDDHDGYFTPGVGVFEC